MKILFKMYQIHLLHSEVIQSHSYLVYICHNELYSSHSILYKSQGHIFGTL